MAGKLSEKTVIKKSRNGRNISYESLATGSGGISAGGGGGGGGDDLLYTENIWHEKQTFNKGLVALNEGTSNNWWYAYKHSQAIKGFVYRGNITIVFDKLTGLLTLNAISGKFTVYVSDTVMYEKTTDSYTIPSVTGIYYVYYDTDGVIKSQKDINTSQLYDLMQITVPIGSFIYDQPSGKFVYTGYSLKGLGTSGLWVKNFFDAGIKRFSDLAVTNLTLGNGNADADARFGLSAGETILADIKLSIPTRIPTATWNILYEDGSSAKIYEAALFPMLTDINLGIGTTGRVVKNNQSNVPSAVTSGKYVWYFCAINNSLFAANRTNMFMGSNEYTNEAAARNNLAAEVGYCETSIRIKQGITIVYAVLIQTKDSFTNAVNARIVGIDTVQNDSLFSSPVPTIPNDLINGADASALHNHDSLYLDWLKTTGGIYYMDKVGIGTSNPLAKFQVGKALSQESPTLGSGANTMNITGSNDLYGTAIGVSPNGDTWFQSQRFDADTAVYNLLLNPSGGNVGIGTNNPLSKLDIFEGYMLSRYAQGNDGNQWKIVGSAITDLGEETMGTSIRHNTVLAAENRYDLSFHVHHYSTSQVERMRLSYLGLNVYGTLGANFFQTSTTFVGGFTGNGWSIDSVGNATLQSLTIRGGFTVFSMTVEEMKVVGGTHLYTDGVIVTRVVSQEYLGYMLYNVYYSNTNYPYDVITATDIVRCQQWNGENQIKYYQAAATSVGYDGSENYFQLWENPSVWSGSSVPAVGDSVVKVGNDAGLSVLEISSREGGYLQIANGINTAASNFNPLLRMGNVQGMSMSGGIRSGVGYGFMTPYFIIDEGGAIIAGWSITANQLKSPLTSSGGFARIFVSSSQSDFLLTPNGNITGDGTSKFVQMFQTDTIWGLWGMYNGNYIFQLGSTNQIATWTFDANRFYNGSILGSGAGIEMNAVSKFFSVHQDPDSFIKMYYTSETDWGLVGLKDGITYWSFVNGSVYAKNATFENCDISGRLTLAVSNVTISANNTVTITPNNNSVNFLCSGTSDVLFVTIAKGLGTWVDGFTMQFTSERTGGSAGCKITFQSSSFTIINARSSGSPSLDPVNAIGSSTTVWNVAYRKTQTNAEYLIFY